MLSTRAHLLIVQEPQVHHLVNAAVGCISAISAGLLVPAEPAVTFLTLSASSQRPAAFYCINFCHALQVPVAARKRHLLQTTAPPSGLDLTNFAQNGLQNTVSSCSSQRILQWPSHSRRPADSLALCFAG